MICSSCKKNTAIVFTNKIINGKQELEGLCFNCAKERGINPIDVLIKQYLNVWEYDQLIQRYNLALEDFKK